MPFKNLAERLGIRRNMKAEPGGRGPDRPNQEQSNVGSDNFADQMRIIDIRMKFSMFQSNEQTLKLYQDLMRQGNHNFPGRIVETQLAETAGALKAYSAAGMLPDDVSDYLSRDGIYSQLLAIDAKGEPAYLKEPFQRGLADVTRDLSCANTYEPVLGPSGRKLPDISGIAADTDMSGPSYG